MNTKRCIFVAFLTTLFIYPYKITAQFYSLETERLRLIYYGKMHSYLVSHVGRCFENSLKFHRNLFDYNTSEKVTVLLHDFGDYGNAGAGVIPRNYIIVSIAPYRYVFETTPANERMNSSMNHELVHVVTLDKASRTDRFFRSLFMGKVLTTTDNPMTMFYSYLTTPRRFSPRWYTEGIAVFLETWMAGGLGRALSPYDEMVFRTIIRDGSDFYDMVGLESQGTKIDFQVGVVSYLYGTRFMSYLARQYGPHSLLTWTSRSDDSKGYFASQFKKTYGTSIDAAWARWIEWERKFQQANLDSIRVYPTTPYRTLSPRALGSVSRMFYDPSRRKLYAAVRYPGQIAHIAAIDIDTGKLDKLCDIKGPSLYFVTSLGYDPSTATLFYNEDNNQWRDLKAIDVKTGNSKTLIKDVRTGDFAFNRVDNSLWGVRHFNGICTLVRIPHPYEEWNQVYSWPYGKDVFDIDISPDGSYLTAALIDEASGLMKLIKMDIQKLQDGDPSYDVLIDFEESAPANFVFSPDGRYLFGTSYYTGVSNVWRYDFEREEVAIISNCETGFFRPCPVSDDSLIVLRYTGRGFVPVIIANEPVEHVNSITFLGQEVIEKYTILEDWMAGPPGSVNIDSLTIHSGRYSGLKNMRLISAYPIVEGYKEYPAYGMRLHLSGPIALHNLILAASYTPNQHLPSKERFHAHVKYSHSNWKIDARYNAADFYDLFGPTKTSRKGYSLGLQYDKVLLYEDPKTMDFSVYIAGYGGLETLPDFQNVEASFDKLATARLGFHYEHLRASLGATEREKGFKWEIFSTNNYVNEKMFPRLYTNFDFGFPLPINHSSIWVRNSFGYSVGDRDEPFANFYFGGFGNNWVDYLPERRYREYYSFPGIELNDVGGTNYGKTMVEWILPPVVFRRLGIPTFYSTWAQLAFFSSGIMTNLDSKGDRRSLVNVGAQIDFKIIMLSHLKATFSLGYAVAFEEDRSNSKEFMISLKVL